MLILSHDIKFGPNLDRWKYCDVRLTTDDSYFFILGHRNILAQVSPVLKGLFDRNPYSYIRALALRNISFDALEKIIELVYEGKINIYNVNIERNIMNAIEQLQMDIKINKDVIVEGSKSTDNVHFIKTHPVLVEEIEDLIPEHKSISPIQGGSGKVCVSNDQVKLVEAHLVQEDECSIISSDREGKQYQQTSLIRDEASYQLSSTCKESSQEERQGNVSIGFLPLPVPASHSIILGGEGPSQERGRSASCSTSSSDEAVRSKRIKVRPDIFKVVGSNDLNDNLNATNEDESLIEITSKTLRISGVKKNILVEDLISYIDSFSVNIESLVKSISVSGGNGLVHFESEVSAGYFDKHVFELEGCKIKLYRPGPCLETRKRKRQDSTFWQGFPKQNK